LNPLHKWSENVSTEISEIHLVVGDSLVLEEGRRRQELAVGVELGARLPADPDEDCVPGVLLAIGLGISGDLVAEIKLE
jgi:lysophospholipase L1-like esterase